MLHLLDFFVFKKDENGGSKDLVVWYYHPFRWKREDIGKVVLIIDKVKVGIKSVSGDFGE